MKTLKIKVKRKHINEGISLTTCCPIALAIKEQARVKWASVTADSIHIGDDTYFTTQKVFDFIQKFDAGKTVVPTEFTLKRAFIEKRV